MINYRLRYQLVPRYSYRPETLYHDSKNRAMLRSPLQAGSFAKIALRAIFKRSALAGKGTLTRCGDSAPASMRSATFTVFYCRAVMVNSNILCTLQLLEELTITDKVRSHNRDNSYSSKGIVYLDKFRLTRQPLSVYRDS